MSQRENQDHAAIYAAIHASMRVEAVPFTLKSGRQSHVYFDLRRLVLDGTNHRALAEMLVQRIKQSGSFAEVYGGMATGSIGLSVLVAGALFAEASYVRREAKGHGTKSQIETTRSLAGRTVLVLEDVTTTGGSALEAVVAYQDTGATVVGVVSVLDRQEGAEEAFKAAGVPFSALFLKSDFTEEK